MLILVIINSLCENYHLITKIFHLKTPQQRTDVSSVAWTVPLSAEQRSLSDGGSQTAKQRCCTQCSPQPLMNITCPWRVQRCSNQRAQTGLGIKLAPALRVWSFVSLSLFFLAHSVIIAWRNGWMRDITVISKIKSACCLVWLLCLLPPSYTQSDLPDPVRQVSVAGVLLKTPPPPVATCLLWHKMSVFWHPESKLTIFILSNLMHLNNPKPTDIVNECNMYIYSALYFLDMQLSV